MSGVSGVDGNNSALLQWLTQASAQNEDPLLAPSSNETALEPVDSALPTETPSLDTGSLSALQQSIRSAVSSAIQDAENSGNTTDLKKVVQDAVAQALKDNGIDPAIILGTQDASGSGGQTDAASDTSTAGSQSSSQIDSQTAALLAQLLTAQQSGTTDLLGYLFDASSQIQG